MKPLSMHPLAATIPESVFFVRSHPTTVFRSRFLSPLSGMTLSPHFLRRLSQIFQMTFAIITVRPLLACLPAGAIRGKWH